MGVQVLSYELLRTLSSKDRIAKILEIVKKKDIVMLEGRLPPEEEAELITAALENIGGKFSGIEVAFLDSKKSDSLLEGIKEILLKLIARNRIGITVIGPSKIIKEIKMDPNKLEILFK